MKITNKSQISFIFVPSLLIFILSALWMETKIDIPTGDSIEEQRVKLDYLSFKLDVYKAIGIGFLIAILGLLIPNILPEIKYKFQIVKEGRQIFSEAKTGIDYFRFKLPDLDRTEAIDHINKIHQLKHLADIYIREYPQACKWPYKKPIDAYYIIMKYLNTVDDPKNS